ncbi:MAG: PPC domain-containing protein [Myxococcaceae bacterium]|nr:PPC domain-containing protein [Myxococcaceae bacterium]
MKRIIVLFAVVAGACAPNASFLEEADEANDTVDTTGQKFSSAVGTLMNFQFEATLWTAGTVSSFGARSAIDEQMLFTIGHLNADKAVGRLDRIKISNVRTVAEGTGTRITYTVLLPVSWGSQTSLPSTYAFTLPRAVDATGIEAFTEKYKGKCVDFGAHDVDSGSIWYYYRPRTSGCALAETDVVRFTATATKSNENTTGKYPEYGKVWEDGALRVVAIFGKYEDGATTTQDAGIAGFNAFIRAMKTELRAYSVTTTPAVLPDSPGVSTPDVTFTATLPNGKQVVVTALLVDNVSTAGAAFDRRYEGLSTRADLIVYNGHAGLGQNVRALSRKGRFVAGQYAIFFMNGCDTFAYVDGSLAQDRARLNPDDPTGTKYMEIVTNGMPAFFSSMPGATVALMKGLLKTDAPMTYQQIFQSVDRNQVVMVTGEEDNVFTPGNVTPSWAGLNENVTVAKAQEARFQTPVLPAGSYRFAISGTGDADLYVRDGAAPTTTTYSCRPYQNGSSEQCVLNLTAPTSIHVMVRGYAASSQVTLTGRAQ